jgi:hypothetical protein
VLMAADTHQLDFLGNAFAVRAAVAGLIRNCAGAGCVGAFSGNGSGCHGRPPFMGDDWEMRQEG